MMYDIRVAFGASNLLTCAVGPRTVRAVDAGVDQVDRPFRCRRQDIARPGRPRCRSSARRERPGIGDSLRARDLLLDGQTGRIDAQSRGKVVCHLPAHVAAFVDQVIAGAHVLRLRESGRSHGEQLVRSCAGRLHGSDVDRERGSLLRLKSRKGRLGVGDSVFECNSRHVDRGGVVQHEQNGPEHQGRGERADQDRDLLVARRGADQDSRSSGPARWCRRWRPRCRRWRRPRAR